MTPEPGVSLMPLPSNGTHALIAIYDMLCDIFLEVRELREHTDMASETIPVAPELNTHILALETRLGPYLLDCITSIIGRHHDLVSSSRLARMLEFALNRARSDEVRIAGLSLMISALKVPTDTTTLGMLSSRGTTPAGIKSASTSLVMSAPGTRQSRAQVTQPLVQHLSAVADGLLHLHSVPPLPLLTADPPLGTAAQTPSHTTHTAVAVKSLEFLSEVIAQGLVSVSDLFEYISPAFLLGPWQVETKARHLAFRVLTSTKDPAAVLRRKMGLVCFCTFAVFSQRYQALPRSSEWSLTDLDHLTIFRTLGIWYEEFARRKVALRAAFLESIVSSWNKLVNLHEVSSLVSNLIEDRGRIVDFRAKLDPASPPPKTLDLLLFVASYSAFLGSLLMTLPYGHLGEVQELIIAIDGVMGPVRTHLRCEDVGEQWGDTIDGEEEVVEDEIRGEVEPERDSSPPPPRREPSPSTSDWSLQFKKVSLGVIGAAGCYLKRDLVRAFRISDLKELQKKKLTNKEGEGKQYHYDGGDSGGSGYVKTEDRCFSMVDFITSIKPILAAVNEDLLASDDEGFSTTNLDAIISAQLNPLMQPDHYRETVGGGQISRSSSKRAARVKPKARAASRRRQQHKDTDNEDDSEMEEEGYFSAGEDSPPPGGDSD